MHKLRLLALALAAPLASCATGPELTPVPQPELGGLTVEIRNLTPAPISLHYADEGGARRHVTALAGLEARTYTLPSGIPEPVGQPSDGIVRGQGSGWLEGSTSDRTRQPLRITWYLNEASEGPAYRVDVRLRPADSSRAQSITDLQRRP